MARKKSATKRAKEALENDTSEATTTIATKESLPEKKKQIQESYDEEESSSSEEEDEYGNLITNNVQEGINKILSTLKSDPKKLLDPEVKFFEDPDNEKSGSQARKSKETPIYLKDYHRMNLLSGNYKDDDENDFETVDGEKPFAVTQREERNQLISDIKNQFDNDDENEDDDDDFLTKKEHVRSRNFDGVETKLPDPEVNQDGFLSAFIDKQAWIPKKNDKVIDLDKIDNEDDEQFDQAVEDFERAYNFRYEDPNSAEIVSYARNQATLRRSATNSRKRQRDKKNDEREKEEEKKQELLKKKKTAKLNKVMDRLEKIKQAVGDEVDDEVIKKVFGESLLGDDFDDADWDSKMAEIFNEQYYNAELSKPEWDEDDEIMSDFNNQKQNDEDGSDYQDKEPVEEDNVEEPPSKKSKKEKLKDKKAVKKEKESLKEKAQEIVEANKLKIIDEVEEERGRSKDNDEVKFKYREVSPETFGLTTRDILLADDKQLNNFIGLKKFAPYRPKELRLKDKRKYTKKRHLQDWRKEVFHDRSGPKLPKDSSENEIWIPMDAAEADMHHKHKVHKKDKKDKKSKHKK